MQFEKFIEIFQNVWLDHQVTTQGIDGLGWTAIRQFLSSFDKVKNIHVRMNTYGHIYSLFSGTNNVRSDHFITLFQLIDECVKRERITYEEEMDVRVRKTAQTVCSQEPQIKFEDCLHLPLDICIQICYYLEFSSLQKLRHVNRKWRHCVNKSMQWHRAGIRVTGLLQFGKKMLEKAKELKMCLRYAENSAGSTTYSPSEACLLCFVSNFILPKRDLIMEVCNSHTPLGQRLSQFLEELQLMLLNREHTVTSFCSVISKDLARHNPNLVLGKIKTSTQSSPTHVAL